MCQPQSLLRCLFLPWLVGSMLQLVLVGCLMVMAAALTSLHFIMRVSLITDLTVDKSCIFFQ